MLINKEYADIAPEVAIEIDTKADLTNFIFQKYVSNKTNKLLNFGIKKVIWIFTYSQQINIAEPDTDWIVSTWSKDIEVIKGITFNTGNYPEENEVVAE